MDAQSIQYAPDETATTTHRLADFAFNAAAALAEGQRAGASGKELIAAVAVGFHINARLNLASVVLRATQVDEDAKDETRNAVREKIRRFRETPSSLSITANGRTFHLKSKYAAGDPWSDETRATWDQVARKFHNFCGHQMSAEKIDRIISQFRALEDIKNIDQEIDLNYDLAATAGGGGTK